MRNGWISTDVFLFSTEEMTYRAFVFTWGISSKAGAAAESREPQGSIPAAWGTSGVMNAWAVTVRPRRR